MYKIYINDNLLHLASSEEVDQQKSTKQRLIAPYSGKTKMLLSYIDMLEKTDRFDEIIIHHVDRKKLLKDFESLFKVIKASGGVVSDEDGRILMIFRRGHWDLPKGKIEAGEKKKEAAIREVEEETGIQNITLLSKLVTSRHTYKLKSGKRAIKKTFWYCMSAAHQHLIPQEEEDISSAEWIFIDQKWDAKEPIYKSIEEILELYKNDKKELILK